MSTKPQSVVTLMIIIFVCLVIGSQAIAPLIAASVEIKRLRANEEITERQMYQQTVMEAELEEKAAQAKKSVATRATAGRIVVLCLAIGAGAFLIGAGVWGGKTLLRRALELPPVQKIDDGLYVLPDMTFCRYSGRQISVRKEYPASQEHAMAYAIAKSAGREHWVRWGYKALEMLPALIAMLKENQIEPPPEALSMMEALPLQE